ncbi:nucleotidyltransferase domain-containing protein [Sulfurimonas sp. NWX79]|uniref:type VII toxin-antitoxin system MntA family adenylyltransferase antitoxin n=1 Tax=Sulfurimonas sp. NWX79 TaxID=2925412 RepID=UPI003204C9A4
MLKNKLSSMDTVEFAYLFGSYARDDFTDSSDVDIAVFLQDTALDIRLQIIYELSKSLQKEIDLIVLNDIKNIFLLENIFKDGIVIKEGEKRFEYEVMRQHDILDYKAFRKYIDAA